MCGILGFFSLSAPDEDNFRKALNLLQHRGPDDQGMLAVDLPFLSGYLGHQRLSIQDLSSAGHQPMSSADKRIHIIFNGEIYNFKELKDNLGFREYKSGTDTEVILACYEKFGVEFIAQMNGMFALCIVDQKSDKIILARDRIGIKPLYYYQSNDLSSLVFASELKSIQQLVPNSLEIDQQALLNYLYFQYIPGPSSILKDVKKLEPGSILILDQTGTKIRKFWSLEDHFHGPQFSGAYEDMLNILDKLITSSISYRMISDVPLGTFLSGGIDSSLVTAYASEISREQISTFSIGFDVPEYNEADHAKEVASYLGTQHTELYLTPNDALKAVPDIGKFFDEPYADSSAIPTRIVSSLAKNSVTVTLSGDGGDELFCGYNRYMWFKEFNKLGGIKGLGWFLRHALSYYPHRLTKKVAALLSWVKVPDQYRSLPNIWHSGEMSQLLKEPILDENPASAFFGGGKGIVEDLMYADINMYLVDDILTKVDRASMSVSLEARVPLLDHRLVEFAARLPLSYKLNGNRSKAPLKDLLHRKLPRSLFDRKKAGFSIPLKDWLQTSLNEWMKDVLSEKSLNRHGFFNKTNIDQMIQKIEAGSEEPVYKLWTILMFQDWYHRYQK